MRPKQRPEVRYTNVEIIKNVWQHFFVEKNPRCVTVYGECLYTKTGCAIGCLITEEDAASLEKYGGGDLASVWDRCPDILGAYFSHHDYPLLSFLQSAHDNSDGSSLLNQLTLVFNEYGYDVIDDELQRI